MSILLNVQKNMLNLALAHSLVLDNYTQNLIIFWEYIIHIFSILFRFYEKKFKILNILHLSIGSKLKWSGHSPLCSILTSF